MQQKQLLWLLGILLVLLGVAYLTGAFSDEISTVDVPDVSIPTDQLEQVDIRLSNETLVLQYTGGTWRLSEPVSASADTNTVSRFVQSLGDLELASVVSTNPERYGRYGVDSAATTVQASWSGGAERVIVGDQGPGFGSVYVRVGDDPRVFLTNTRLNIPDDVDRWRDRTVLNLPVARVASVEVTKGDTSFTVTRSDGSWQIDEQGTTASADSAGVTRWLQRFASMTASGFLVQASVAEVQDAADHRIAFGLDNGTTFTLWFDERESNVAVATDQRNEVFEVMQSRLNTYVPDPSTLK